MPGLPSGSHRLCVLAAMASYFLASALVRDQFILNAAATVPILKRPSDDSVVLEAFRFL